MKKLLLTLLILFTGLFAFSQGVDCNSADPFCTSNNYIFPASTNVPNAGSVDCLLTTPNPAWYWMQIDQSGPLDITISNTALVDVDFICWGPFPSLPAACASNLMNLSGVDCSYLIDPTEYCNIPWANSGEVYVLLITNFSNTPTNITFSQTGGTATTNCGIIAPPVIGDTVCEGKPIQLTVTNPTPGATYAWTGPNGWNSANMNPIIPISGLSMSGTYSLVITVGTQVSPPVTCTVLVNPNPTITITPLGPSTCSGTPVDLTGNSTTAGTTYSWSTGFNGNPLTVSPTIQSTYTVTGTDVNGCSGTATTTVNIIPGLNITVNPSSGNICIGESIDLTASGADSLYTWSPAGTLNNSTGTTVTATPISPTITYTVTGTSTNGCTGSTTVTITTFAPVSLTITGTPSTVCPGGESILTVDGNLSNYTWSPATWLSTTTGSVTTATPMVTTTYTVTSNNGGCISSATFTLVVHDFPTPSFVATPTEGCEPLYVTFLSDTANIANCTWNFGDNTIPVSGDCNPTHGYEFNGTYDVTLTVTDFNGCTMSITYPELIQVWPLPVASYYANPDYVSEIDATVWFTDGSAGASGWHWYFGEDFVLGNTSTLQNPTHIFSDTGYFDVTLVAITNHGCTDTLTQTIYVEPLMTMYVPNAFSPNRDPNNPIFLPYGVGIDESSFNMRIFNRHGEELLYTEDIHKGWDGTYDGKLCPQGVYVYYIGYSDIKYNYHFLKGTVTLIR